MIETGLPPDISEVVASWGYVPCDGGPLDTACAELVREYMSRPARSVDVLLQRLQDKEHERLPYLKCHLPNSAEVRGWVPTATIHYERRRYSLESMAEYAHQNAQDFDEMQRVSGGLWVKLARTPWDGLYLSSVTKNGNHRAAVYCALGLPLMPAHISVVDMTEFSVWGLDQPNGLLQHLIDEGLLTEVQPRSRDRVAVRDVGGGAWAWFVPGDSQGTARMLEARFMRLLPEPYRSVLDSYNSTRVRAGIRDSAGQGKRAWWQRWLGQR